MTSSTIRSNFSRPRALERGRAVRDLFDVEARRETSADAAARESALRLRRAGCGVARAWRRRPATARCRLSETGCTRDRTEEAAFMCVSPPSARSGCKQKASPAKRRIRTRRRRAIIGGATGPSWITPSPSASRKNFRSSIPRRGSSDRTSPSCSRRARRPSAITSSARCTSRSSRSAPRSADRSRSWPARSSAPGAISPTPPSASGCASPPPARIRSRTGWIRSSRPASATRTSSRSCSSWRDRC